jgi:prepilin-type N-terminal cleavage/methylation domain-containing protein
MKRLHKDSGFTILELSIAIAATAILVVTAGIMLQYTARAIKQQSAMANLQRDMRVALPVIYRLSRVASSKGVTVPSSIGVTGTVFTVTNSSAGFLSLYRANSSLVSDAGGTNLVYERGVGNKIVLSSGWVKTFFVSRKTNSISFKLELDNTVDNTNDAINVNGDVCFRN